MKKHGIWLMCGTSDSGDHYHGRGSWTHKPSQEEINRIRIALDSKEFEKGTDDENDDGFIELDGKKYITYINEFVIFEI